MNNNLIEINIKNFKSLEELNIKNLKRINLISGKNNVGKTAFMEAIELFVSSNDVLDLNINIYEMIKRRQKTIQERYFELDFIYENSTKTEIKNNNKNISIEYIEMSDENLQELFQDSDGNYYFNYENFLKLKVNQQEKIIPIDTILHNPSMVRRERMKNIKSKITFINSTIIDEKEIAVLYGKLVDFNKEEFLNDSLKLFDENIIALKQKATKSGIVLKIALKDRELPVLLSSLGEGLNRFIAILCGIWASKDGFLFIDEIENGIHYTNYPKLWKIIFEVSKKANCQVFITTHSKECIESFNQCNNEEGVLLEFYKNKKNKIVAKTRDKELLDYSLSHNGRVRGE